MMPVSPSAPFTYAKYSVASVSHPDGNEDRIVADAHLGLAAVFDGVGSAAGAAASRTAARVIRQGWKKALGDSQLASDVMAARGQLDVPATLQRIMQEAHARLQSRKARVAGQAGAGLLPRETTAVLAVFCQDSPGEGYTMFYAHVGDSRIYLLRPGEPLTRLTDDDGYMMKLVNKGALNKADALRIDQAMTADQLSEQEKEYFDKRNGITQSLGDSHAIVIHSGQITLLPGDRVLLCSDGVHDNLLDSEIAETLRQKARITPARALVQRALKRSEEDSSATLRPKADDMSALVVSYRRI